MRARTRPQAAAELARKLAEANPERTFWLVGDSAYVNAATLQGRPANLRVIGPLHWKAALYERPGPYGGRGRPPKKGARLPAPKALIEDDHATIHELYPAYNPETKQFDESNPDGDILTTGLRVVHPDSGSPLKKETFAETTEFISLSDFKKWLAEHNLTGS